MKKALLEILAAVILISVCAMPAFAAGPEGGRGKGMRNFTDADGDGICDNSGRISACADADGDGICDLCGAACASGRAGAGRAFVDADGDGVCDNYNSGQGRGGHGCGSRGGCGNGFCAGRGR